MQDRLFIVPLGLAAAALVAGAGCEGTAAAEEDTASIYYQSDESSPSGGASQQSKVRTQKRTDSGADPVKEALLADLARRQESRYCREMLGVDTNRPATAPDYRPEPGELCYALWRDRVLHKELTRYADYYRPAR
jgi:hypothetical protein